MNELPQWLAFCEDLFWLLYFLSFYYNTHLVYSNFSYDIGSEMSWSPSWTIWSIWNSTLLIYFRRVFSELDNLFSILTLGLKEL